MITMTMMSNTRDRSGTDRLECGMPGGETHRKRRATRGFVSPRYRNVGRLLRGFDGRPTAERAQQDPISYVLESWYKTRKIDFRGSQSCGFLGPRSRSRDFCARSLEEGARRVGTIPLRCPLACVDRRMFWPTYFVRRLTH